MRLAERVSRVPPSATMVVTERAAAMRAAGRDVLSFSAGEPDFPTPPFVVEAMVAAARAGATRYCAAAGLPALRDAVASWFGALYGAPFAREQVLVSVGGKHGLYNLFQALVDPGDEVLVPAPYWVSTPAQVGLAGGVAVPVATLAAEGFRLDLAALEAAVTERTVGLVINSPCNPTGAVLTPAELRAVAALAEAHDLWIVSDDIYSELRYDDAPFASVLRERPDLRERLCVVHGTSKTYAMTGWRIGFVGASREVIAAVAKLQGQETSNPATFAQHGALAALTGERGYLAHWLSAYDQRRRRVTALLDGLDGVSCPLPGGAFYVFPDVRGLLGRRFDGEVIGTDLRLAELLLEHAEVAVVPGEAFGGPGHVRLSYACSLADIERGLARVATFVARLT